jgi:Calcineurin-like phosphoesterase
MRKFVFGFFLLFAGLPAQAAETAWVQAVAGGYEARVVTEEAQCPVLQTDKGTVTMTVRAKADANFPLVCAAPVPVGAASLRILDTALPAPVARPQRIMVLGDTGCRIKGAALQACNDPARWPFPSLAVAAAKLKPDLVIHVGDYLYREGACPAGNQGCAGSPWGDNWTTWQADFFSPAAPLFQEAPVVLARGNHEACNRSGPGWLRLQGPTSFDAQASCVAHLPAFTVNLAGLTLAVMDDATAEETDLDRDMAQTYATELAGIAKLPAPVWLVHHRPIWGADKGPLGIPVGGNLTWMEASRIAAGKGGSLIPLPVELMLSGHIHTFEAINFEQDVPPQLVAGNGGTYLEVTPRNLRGTQFLGHSGVTVADGLSVAGFGFLLMTRAPDGWTIDLYDPLGQPKGQCRFVAPTRGHVGKLDCAGLKG